MPGSASDGVVPPAANDEEDDGGMGVDVELNRDETIDFVVNFGVAHDLGKFEPTFDDEVSNLLLSQMGSERNYKRELPGSQADRHRGVFATTYRGADP